MKPQTWETLREFTLSPIMRATSVPSEEEIADAARAVGCTFHEDYLAFLRRFGGAMVGPLPVFGLRPVKVDGEAMVGGGSDEVVPESRVAGNCRVVRDLR